MSVVHTDYQAQCFDKLGFLHSISDIPGSLPEAPCRIDLHTFRHNIRADSRIVYFLRSPIQHLRSVVHPVKEQGRLRNKTLTIAHRLPVDPEGFILYP